MFQDDLEVLRKRLNAFQPCEGSGEARDSVLAALPELQRSLWELQSTVAGLMRDEQPRSTTAARNSDCSREEGLRESQARKAAILDASLDAVIAIDPQRCVLEFNAAAELLFGLPRELVLGRDVVELIVPPRLRKVARTAIASFETGGTATPDRKRFESFAMKADGTEFPVEVAVAPLGVGEPTLLTVFVYDATSRRSEAQQISRYQDRLHSLVADLLLTEERERRRLAADLHDGLSQTIALARMKLSALRVTVDAGLSKSLDEIEQLIEHANSSARTIGFELSPAVLHDLGLQPALQWLAENIQARYGIEVVLQDDGQPKPADEETRVILFRSIRELLINAAKHAGTRRVHLRLVNDGDHLDAAVEDDGVGMEAETATTRGSGLFSIQERLSHVGGSMRIESAPGRGTKVRLSAPIENSASTRARAKA